MRNSCLFVLKIPHSRTPMDYKVRTREICKICQTISIIKLFQSPADGAVVVDAEGAEYLSCKWLVFSGGITTISNDDAIPSFG